MPCTLLALWQFCLTLESIDSVRGSHFVFFTVLAEDIQRGIPAKIRECLSSWSCLGKLGFFSAFPLPLLCGRLLGSGSGLRMM